MQNMTLYILILYTLYMKFGFQKVHIELLN